MTDPEVITSGLSMSYSSHGVVLDIEICRMEDESEWSLEIVNEEGTSTVWDDLFESDEAALAEAIKAIEKEGVFAFHSRDNIVPFRR